MHDKLNNRIAKYDGMLAEYTEGMDQLSRSLEETVLTKVKEAT